MVCGWTPTVSDNGKCLYNTEFPQERNSAELEREGRLGRYSSPAKSGQGKSEELAGAQKRGRSREREREREGERESIHL